ncbi:125L [Invertebrate iridescent virus 6]|uniref:125L n=1 Tax=Invertebrate iridescent virus 6 TaxID=176652 RepID=Q91G10_IIV6|nr:125L [Invertebrate iridescent virus 6]AAK82022.1 125L [Invertebrate iridescent virus 6]QMS79621.1 hypothetical protein IIV6-T1_129 [Invertebrate iridescent virus 6]
MDILMFLIYNNHQIYKSLTNPDSYVLNLKINFLQKYFSFYFIYFGF